MQKLLIAFLLIFCHFGFAQKDETPMIDDAIQQWHKAASDADFDAYFGLMTSNSIFIGTDPTENWDYNEFKAYAKPHFDKGKAWSFTTLERNIFTEKNMQLAWFDELLDTQMGICRGSGIVKRTPKGWKIQHYVLSIAIPNKDVKEITRLKKQFDIDLMKKLRGK